MMPSDVIAPTNTVTFTITKTPRRPADRKTVQRLMRMQPDIQKGLKRLARRRRQHDNRPGIRAGVLWIDRVKTTKLTRPVAGETFTLMITPQIIADIKSVEAFLDAKKA